MASDFKPQKMLVILAHPDDESFAVGGTLAKYAHRDVQVILLCATRGEKGIPNVAPEKTAIIREAELRKAAASLGIEVHFMGYRDGELAKADPRFILGDIGSWLDLFEPQIILTFGPDGVSGHPDHVIISQMVTQAYDQFYQKGMLLYIYPSEATVLGCGVLPENRVDNLPLLSIDISEYKLEKVKAIQCHASQKPDLNGRPEELVNKSPCSEIFSIARNMLPPNDPNNWFEKTVESRES